MTNGGSARLCALADAILHGANHVGGTPLLSAALPGRIVGRVGALTIGGTNAPIMLTAVAITHHQIYHSAAPEHFDRNFGNVLTVVDRLFGIFFLPAERRGAMRFGVDDGEARPHGLRAMLVTPFVASAALLIPRWPRKRLRRTRP